ncbi:ZIP family metal transporter [Irregularibacter muris]|uniref:ZIP family metal transporter n=1 Tax=Irregularibacter muris TaxID=1796619 RepID=A0AAE3HGH8_9FIRM|nr:ZIP family metal transporter [Irregularibacter muris]MCR1900216.1 ZIP family metal transporter [Irregularibacter muris]
MEKLLMITIIGFLAGMVGTGIGGLSAYLFIHPSKRAFSVILGLAGGLMISIVCFDLLPQAFEMVGVPLGVFGIICGVAIITIIDEIMDLLEKGKKKQRDGFIKAGVLIGIGIAAHNFPEGLAIGAGFMATPQLGLGLALVITLHNIPEGIAMATPMSIGGVKKIRILFYTLLAGIPMGVGAFLGALLGEISPAFIGWCLGLAGGAMLFITCQEIIPRSREIWKGRISGFGIILGIIGGILLSSLI